MGTICWQVRPHDRHENVRGVGAVKRTPEKVRLRAGAGGNGCEGMARQELERIAEPVPGYAYRAEAHSVVRLFASVCYEERHPVKGVTGGKTMTSDTRKRELIISKGWVQAAILVFLFGFTVLGWLAYRTYVEEPPIPQRVVDPAGNVLFTGVDIMSGQQVFLRNGLMEYGSVLGHGAYLGPDYTAEY